MTLFNSLALRGAREAAKQHNVTIPKGMTTWRSDHGSHPYYEVWANSQIVHTVWVGSASEAKASYIWSLIDEVANV